MLGKLNKLLVALLLVSISVYLVNRNDQLVRFTITNDLVFPGKLGAVVIGAFAFGVLLTTLIAVIFGIRSYFRERGFKNQIKTRDQLFDKVLEARAASSSHQWNRARALWEQLIKKDSKALLPRIELAATMEREGLFQEALKVLDDARASAPKNTEILLLAGELNRKIGNKTAALDNFSLAQDIEPSIRTATFAAELAEDLNRFDEALKFHTFLSERKSGNLSAESRVRFKQLINGKTPPTTPDEIEALRKEYTTFLKRFPNCSAALGKIAEFEAQLGRFDAAGAALANVAKQEKTLAAWNKVVDFWISHQNPEKALAIARLAREELQGKDRFAAELNLIRLMLHYNMLDDAGGALSQFGVVVNTRATALTESLLTQYFALQGMYYLRKGDARSASELWTGLFSVVSLHGTKSKTPPVIVSEAPSPVLSTP